MDNIWLTGPLGTQWNIGSWIDKTAEIDYGAGQLVRQQLTQTTFVEGAKFAYETTAGARKMAFPVRVPSGGIAGLSLDAIEASLRQMTRPGAYVDLQPNGVPTAEMVRFDLVGGDISHRGYSVDLQRVARRELTVTMLTQPFGYWPTWIVLASVPSIAAVPGVRALFPAASVFGDVPAFVKLDVRSNYTNATALPYAQQDFLAWSFGSPSVPTALASPGITYSNLPNALASDTSASWLSFGQVVRATYSAFTATGLQPLVGITNAGAKGRFRTFGFFRMAGGNIKSLGAMVDVVGLNTYVTPAATGNAMATISPIASLGGGSYYSMVDLGEIGLPHLEASTYDTASVANNYVDSSVIRLYLNIPSSGTTMFDFAGLYLLPVDGPAGILPRGMFLPDPLNGQSYGGAFAFDFSIDSKRRTMGIRPKTDSNLDGDHTPPDPGSLYYLGGMPYLGGSDRMLQLLPMERLVGTTILSNGGDAPLRRNQAWVGYSVAYQPRFTFSKGI